MLNVHFLSVKPWLQFATLWLGVVIVGFAVSFYVLPRGVIWFVSALSLLVGGIFLITPK